MIAFQRQLNLRNKDVIISNPEKKAIENKASTSGNNKPIDNLEVIIDLGNGKRLLTNQLLIKNKVKEISPHKNFLKNLWKIKRIWYL